MEVFSDVDPMVTINAVVEGEANDQVMRLAMHVLTVMADTPLDGDWVSCLLYSVVIGPLPLCGCATLFW